MKNRAVFVVGTGTDVGKTYVSALLVKKLAQTGSVSYFKAAMSGNQTDGFGRPVAGDAEYVKMISGIDQSVESMCPYVYGHAYSPHLAAKTENRQIETDVVMHAYREAARGKDYTVAEGSGGIVCPLRYDGKSIFLYDIIAEMNIPCVLVTHAGLGAINSVVLTCEFMRRRNLKLSGVIYNRYEDNEICRDNLIMCKKITGLDTIAAVKEGDTQISFDTDKLFGGTGK